MELKEFVSVTITQIVQGVADASEAAERLGAFVNPADKRGRLEKKAGAVLVPGQGVYPRSVQMVDFDVAVAVAGETTTKVGGGILTVVSLGASHEKGVTQETTSRIKFSIPITLPLHLPKTDKTTKDQRPQPQL